MTHPAEPPVPDRPGAGQPQAPGPMPAQAPVPPASGHQIVAPPGPGYAPPGPAGPGPARGASWAAGPADTAKNLPGTTAFILGLAILALQLIRMIGQAFIFSGDDYSSFGTFSFALSVVNFVLGGAAVAFGIVGLMRRGTPKAFAGIGTGLGISALFDVLSGLLYAVISPLFS